MREGLRLEVLNFQTKSPFLQQRRTSPANIYTMSFQMSKSPSFKNEALKTDTSSCKSEKDQSLTQAPELESDRSAFQRDVPECLQSYTRDELKGLERKLVRRMDFRILPVIIVMFLFNIIDRNGLTNARLGTLEEDTNLQGSQYQTVLMILYVGYLLAQVPSNAILPYTRPSLYLPACMAVWGCVSAATGAANSFGGLLACRLVVVSAVVGSYADRTYWLKQRPFLFLLQGFLEAPFLPGAVFMLSCWYTRRELPAR